MAGIDNSVVNGIGLRIDPSTATALTIMQDEADGVGFLNVDGDPEGNEAANPASLAMDRTNGALYLKVSGTGNTGWEQIESGTDVATTYTADSGSATPAANNLNVLGGTACSTSGSGSTLTINVDGGGFEWVDVTGTSDDLEANTGFSANNAGLVTLTLPTTCTVGDRIIVTGVGAGGWAIAQNAGQTIHIGSSSTTTGVGGSLASTNQRDSLTLVCVVTNTDFNVLSVVGNITVV